MWFEFVLAIALLLPIGGKNVHAGKDCPTQPSETKLKEELLKPSLEMRKTVHMLSDEPSPVYVIFEKWNRDFETAARLRCPTIRKKFFQDVGTTFDREWEYQRTREADRALMAPRQKALVQQVQDRNAQAKATQDAQVAAIMADRAAKEEKRRADDEAREQDQIKQAEINAKETAENQAEAVKLAKKAGHKKVLFGESLTSVIQSMMEGETSLQKLRGVVIELDNSYDTTFTALQVLGKNTAIYTSPAQGPVVMLKNYGEIVLEGSELTAIRNSYVVIKKVTTYRTAIGTKQAIVIETAW